MHGEHPESCTPLPTLCLALRAQRFAPKKPAGKGRGLESCPLPACFVLCFLFFYFWLSWIRPCRLLQQRQRLGAGRADLFFFFGEGFCAQPSPRAKGGMWERQPQPCGATRGGRGGGGGDRAGARPRARTRGCRDSAPRGARQIYFKCRGDGAGLAGRPRGYRHGGKPGFDSVLNNNNKKKKGLIIKKWGGGLAVEQTSSGARPRGARWVASAAGGGKKGLG